MRSPRTAPRLLIAAIAVAALPTTAEAQYLVPPGNSAATQYTESLPTAGGKRNTERKADGRDRSPERVLGTANARRLEAQGKAGRAVAELVAETAPVPRGDRVARGETAASTEGRDRDATPNSRGRNLPAEEQDDSLAPASGGPAGGGVSGSSGLGEVISQAIGGASPAGGIGALLPLTILGAIAWSLAVAWRQRGSRAS